MLYFLIRMEAKMRRMRIAMWVFIALALLLAAFIYIETMPPPNGKYDAFAKCIAHTSTTFYGAFWCPHCQNQKRAFGSGAQYLPYVECSLPDGSGRTPVCIAKGIQNYPTWYFPDGSSSTGEQSLETISQKTGCPLPTST